MNTLKRIPGFTTLFVASFFLSITGIFSHAADAVTVSLGGGDVEAEFSETETKIQYKNFVNKTGKTAYDFHFSYGPFGGGVGTQVFSYRVDPRPNIDYPMSPIAPNATLIDSITLPNNIGYVASAFWTDQNHKVIYTVPEPSSILGALTGGVFGVGAVLKRKRKLFNSTAK